MPALSQQILVAMRTVSIRPLSQDLGIHQRFQPRREEFSWNGAMLLDFVKTPFAEE